MTGDAAFLAWVDEARRVPIADVARERAPGLKRVGGELVGPCPACGGRDRFAVHPGKGVFHCRGSGTGGDVITLVQYVDGCSFMAACEALTGQPPPGRLSGESPEDRREREARLARREEERRAADVGAAQREVDYRERERTRCHDFWKAAGPIAGTPVERYLALRGIPAPAGAHLRFAPDHPLFGEAVVDEAGRKNWPVLHRGPVMLAAIVGPDGMFSGLHATWIDLADRDGKARVLDPETGELAPAKKVRGTKRGGRIELVRLDAPHRLFLGEGIETVLSMRVLTAARHPDLLQGAAFWSTIDLGNLSGRAVEQVAHPTLRTTDVHGRERVKRVPGPDPDLASPAVPVPDSVTELWLLGDGDSDPFTTELALERAARRFARAGREIFIAYAPEGRDFNDVIRGVAA